MKHEIILISDEMENDPSLVEILDLLRKWAIEKKFNPEKLLTVRFKSQIFPITNKDTK